MKVIVLYSTIFFLLLFFYDNIPKLFSININQILITFTEVLFFSLFFYFIISNKFLKRVILITIPLFLTFQVLHRIFSERVVFDAIPSGAEAIIILSYTVYFFYEELNRSPEKSFYNNYLFWISLGIMLYLAGTFFFFILANSMPLEQAKEFWFITYLIETLKNILMIIALILYLKSEKNPITEKNKSPFLDFTP